MSNMSFRWSFEAFEVLVPLRNCCFSSKKKRFESSGRYFDAWSICEMYVKSGSLNVKSSWFGDVGEMIELQMSSSKSTLRSVDGK